MAVIGDVVIGRGGIARLPVSGGYAAAAYFSIAMPEGSTYTRTGAATGLTNSGALTTFSANEPQRTNRGLALEPERTNLFPRYAPTLAQLGISANTSNTTEPTSPPISGLAWINIDNTSALAAAYQYIPGVANGTATAMQILVETADGSQPVAGTNTTTGDFCFVSKENIASFAFTYRRLTGNVWLVTGTGTGNTAASTGFGIIRYATQSKRALKFSGFGVEVSSSFATSPIVSVGSALTRGLPVFTETVPVGRTKALLTYADASTTLIEGLTPSGTFDYVTPVLAANKGRFGASELVSRVWQS